MENLQAYISNINPQLLKYITGKMGMLIRTIQENKFVSEEALIRQVCGEERERKYYLNLKSRTIKMLQALAIVSTPKGESEIKKKFDFCVKNFAIGQKFLGKGQREEGIRLIKQAHRITIDYDFVHLASEFSSILFYHYVYFQRNSKIAAKYAAQVDRYSADYRIEKKAEYYLYQVIANLNGRLKPTQLKNAIEQVSLLGGSSLKYKIYLSMLNVLYGFNIGDYLLVIKYGKSALNSFKKKKGIPKSHYFFFLNNLGIAQMAIKNHVEAEVFFIEAKKYTYVKAKNEKLVPLYQAINSLHAGAYEKAYQLYRENRKCRFKDIRLQFAIIEAYLCFLSKMGYLHLKGRFRIGKYLNETFKAQSDKQGSNIAILIAELLVYLARDRGKFIDRVEAINNYSYRHLKGEETKRAKRFIKILCLLPRANFKAKALERIAARQIDFINKHPISMGQNVSIEIIPFEHLLKMILRTLAQKVA